MGPVLGFWALVLGLDSGLGPGSGFAERVGASAGFSEVSESQFLLPVSNALGIPLVFGGLGTELPQGS